MKHIIKEIFKRLDTQLIRIKKDCDEETIHHFRIEVKKLRAFLQLLSHGQPKPTHLKIPGRLKKIYILTGKLRDLQLLQTRVHKIFTKTKQPNTYLLFLREKTKARKKELRAGIEEKHLSRIEKKITNALPEQLTKADREEFFQQKEADSKTIITSGNHTDKALHSIRKNTKDILYIFKIYEKGSGSRLPVFAWNKTQLQKATVLADQLGQLNDLSVALAFLRPGRLRIISPKERKPLQKTYVQWLSEKTFLKKNLVNKVWVK